MRSTSLAAMGGLFSVASTLALVACGGGGGASVESPAALEIPAWASVTALGGDTTNTNGNQSSTGFDTPASNLSAEALDLHLAGDTEFEAAFIKAPSTSFPLLDGVGPVFNNNACAGCHTRDGRGNYTVDAQQAPAGS